MRKKILAMLLAVMMVAAMLPTAFAADEGYSSFTIPVYAAFGVPITFDAVKSIDTFTTVSVDGTTFSAVLHLIKSGSGVTLDRSGIDADTGTYSAISRALSYLGNGEFAIASPDPVLYAGSQSTMTDAEFFAGGVAGGSEALTPFDAIMWLAAPTIIEIAIPESLYNGTAATEPEGPAEPTGPAPTFTDVKSDDWFAKEVQWAVEQGVTSGTGDNTFSPYNICSHGEIITFLWRAAGKPAATAQAPVETLPYDDFRAAANWAYENGIIDGTFLTGAECTRADTVTYMWKAAGSPNDAPAGNFSDVPAGIAPAVSWAVSRNVTLGTGDGTTFSPGLICTRGEIVTFLYRAYAD